MKELKAKMLTKWMMPDNIHHSGKGKMTNRKWCEEECKDWWTKEKIKVIVKERPRTGEIVLYRVVQMVEEVKNGK